MIFLLARLGRSVSTHELYSKVSTENTELCRSLINRTPLDLQIDKPVVNVTNSDSILILLSSKTVFKKETEILNFETPKLN